MASSNKTSKPPSSVLTEGHSPTQDNHKGGAKVQVVDENEKSENEVDEEDEPIENNTMRS